MGIIWKWLLRPVVVVTFGAGAAVAAESNPAGGCLIALISLCCAAWTILDILHTISHW
jgi:hypothetical protein